MDEYKCVACGGTGKNSKGGPCVPCENLKMGLRDDLSKALRWLFDSTSNFPTRDEVIRIVDWAYSPKVQYVAGYRFDDGAMAMFSGPTPSVDEVLESEPPNECDAPAFVVKITKAGYGENPKPKPIYRWKNGKWVGKKKKAE